MGASIRGIIRIQERLRRKVNSNGRQSCWRGRRSEGRGLWTALDTHALGAWRLGASEAPQRQSSQGGAPGSAGHHKEAEQPALRAGLPALAACCRASGRQQQAEQAHSRHKIGQAEQRGEPAAAAVAALAAAAVPAATAAIPAVIAASTVVAAITTVGAEGGGQWLRAARPSLSARRERR